MIWTVHPSYYYMISSQQLISEGGSFISLEYGDAQKGWRATTKYRASTHHCSKLSLSHAMPGYRQRWISPRTAHLQSLSNEIYAFEDVHITYPLWLVEQDTFNILEKQGGNMIQSAIWISDNACRPLCRVRSSKSVAETLCTLPFFLRDPKLPAMMPDTPVNAVSNYHTL